MVMIVAQHFLLSRQAKTLTLASVFRMTDSEAETTFKAIRWPDTNGEPVCPECGCNGHLGLPAEKRMPALPVLGLSQELFHHVGHTVCFAQATAAAYVAGPSPPR